MSFPRKTSLWWQGLEKLKDSFLSLSLLLKSLQTLQEKYVPLSETIRGFKGIVNGDYDDIPEQAFLMAGGIDEVVEKAKSEAA